MGTAETIADLYLRLSDGRVEEALDGREAKLRAEARRLGWTVGRVVVENDVNGGGKLRPASAYKRRKFIIDGEERWRVDRPGFRSVVSDLMTGRATALLAEDLDRLARDSRDLEDLIDCAERKGAIVRSLSSGQIRLDTGDGRVMARVVNAFSAKESEDKGRRVADARERLAGQSYQGGKRPFGFRVAEDTEKYHRNLVKDETEAGVIESAAAAILDQGISLKAIARDLRDRGVPTVTGCQWTASTLRDVLSKPAVAGLAAHRGELRPAPWPAILERDQWERLTALFDGRKTGTSNEPRWLVSCYATCGVCGGPVKCTGSAAPAAPTRAASTVTSAGPPWPSTSTSPPSWWARLSLPGAKDLLKPPPRPDVDAKALRAQAKKLNGKRDDLARLLTEEVLTEAGVRAERKRIDAQLAKIGAQLGASDEADPLPEFRGDQPAAAVWESLSLPRKRAVVRLLTTVTILPVTRKGRGFDYDSVQIEWKA